MTVFSGSYFFFEIFIWTEAVPAVFAKNRGILREKRNTFTVTEYRFFLKSVPLPIPFTASSKNLYRNTVPQKFSIPLPLPLPQKRYTAQRYSVIPYLCRPLVKPGWSFARDRSRSEAISLSIGLTSNFTKNIKTFNPNFFYVKKRIFENIFIFFEFNLNSLKYKGNKGLV